MRTIKQNPTMLFGNELRKARKEAGLTQIELAKASGLSHMSIRRYETNDRLPELDSFLALSEALPASSDIIVAWIDNHMEQICSMIPEDKSYQAMDYALDLGDKVTRYNCIQKIKTADNDYLICLSKILESLETMNQNGRWKAQEAADLISRIPEYQSAHIAENHTDSDNRYSENSTMETAHNIGMHTEPESTNHPEEKKS